MNLVIAPAGDKSLHKEWLTGKPNFDLVLLYYGDNMEVAKSYTQDTPYVFASKGFKNTIFCIGKLLEDFLIL